MGNNSNKILGNNSKDITQKYIVSIDFGSAGIGYAFSPNINNNNGNINPVLGHLTGQVDNKLPNEIVLDSNDLNKVLAFGNECSSYINDNKREQNYKYFKDIKMNLYKKNYYIKLKDGKEIAVEKIISKILKYISNHAINQIKQNYNLDSLSENDIKWVVTIPAIWEEESKQIMIKASKKAGLINDNTDLSLFLALELEVAGIFYFSDLNINLNKEERDKQLKNPFIICDIGAGTVDICTLKKEKNEENLIEEYPPLGGDYGGNYINIEFIKILIEELFGKERVEKISNEIKDDGYIQFEKAIEELKRKLVVSENEKDDKNKYFNLDCRIFSDKNKKLDEYIVEYNKNHQYELKQHENREGELLFPKKVFIDIISNIAKKISSKLEEVYNNVPKAQIIFTGAGSKNDVLISKIKEFFKEKKVKFKTTIQPEVSILKGAIIYGFKNSIIRKRKPKYTIGIRTSRDWDNKLHGSRGIKVFNKIDQKYKCCNLFREFITRNKYIEFDKIVSHEFISNGKNPKIMFYKTKKKTCTFIDEKDENNELVIKKFGEVKFHIKRFDMNNRIIRIDMKMGGTCIYATAQYLKEKIEITKSFDENKIEDEEYE